MARKIVTIQTRRGNSSDFDKTKMVAGEIATAEDTEQAYISFSDGTAEELAFKRDLDNVSADITIDSTLSVTSENPVQNKAITAKINELEQAIGDSSGGGGSGTFDHSRLLNRDASDQHPLSAITGLISNGSGNEFLSNDGTYKQIDVDIPSSLPNPHKLTISGAVSAEYDGSKAVTIEIPTGGTGDGGTSDHRQLANRDAADQHPISAITGLQEALSDTKGEPGIGIESIEQTVTSNDPGGVNVITITKTDGDTDVFEIRNGPTGPSGAAGIYVRDPETETVDEALAAADAVGAVVFIDPADSTTPEYITTENFNSYILAAGIPLERDAGFIPEVGTAASKYTEWAVEFKRPFTGKPVVTPCWWSISTAHSFGKVELSVSEVTKTGCKFRVFNNDSVLRSPSIIWRAEWWPELGEDMYATV